MTFKELGIAGVFNKALKEQNIITPTEIQEQAIPFLLKNGSDFIGQAQTGTGKTAAFGLPLLSHIDPQNDKVQALILAPTRELGQQIAKELFRFTKYSEKIFTESVYGGAPIERQISALRRPTQIVVATPGRLVDLLKRRAINLEHVKTIVLDEADEMMKMGFKEDIDIILQKTNGQRSTWLFSATMPPDIRKIIRTYMSPKAYKVEIDRRSKVNKDIEHQFVVCNEKEKLEFLLHFLKVNGKARGVIFCKTKSAAQTLSKQLISRKYQADAIHGALLQKERDKVMRAFKNQNLQILVATDIAARGIDVENLSYVVHYQLPDQVDYYTHRSGRTARAGNKGLSLSFIENKEMKNLKFIERSLGIKMKRIRI
ncbi:MAG: DEAD/DEAH box helicase [Marinifilaceae bacterium]